MGKQISDSVMPVTMNPEDYVNYGREIPELSLQNTTPEHIQKIIKKLQPKLSQDSQGVSTKIIKLIGPKISHPLAHTVGAQSIACAQSIGPSLIGDNICEKKLNF